MNLQKQSSDRIQEDAINLVGLFSSLWNGRKFILKTTLLFVFFGLLLAFIIPKEYTATTVMVPQISDPKSKLGNLSGLAAMAGFNLNAADESEITPKIYPQIITSAPFQLEIMNTPLKFKNLKNPATLYEYYVEIRKPNPFLKYSIGLPGVIIKLIKGKNDLNLLPKDDNQPIQFTDEQIEVQEIIKDVVTVGVNESQGFVTLGCTLPEPIAAAQLAQKAQQLLKKYITEFKIEKAKANEDFVQQRYDEVEAKYIKAQDELALFRDRNKNVSTAVARTELERLTSKYNLIGGVYSELAKKLEQSKIQVKEETPIFTIVQPVMVPVKKSKPNRPMILGVSLLLGLFVGSIIISWKEYFKQVKKAWLDGQYNSL
jgi:hypothetical protein